MEEVWTFLKEDEDYAALADMPVVQQYPDTDDTLAQWQEFMKFRDEVLKSLEEARNRKDIGKSFEAAVTIYPDKHLAQLLSDLNTDVAQLLIVSKLTIADAAAAKPADGDQYDNATIVVSHAPGEVCPRCRMTREDIGIDKDYPELCGRCAKIVAAAFPETKETGLEA
jgi:isoleucyl-tRNA synthetase